MRSQSADTPGPYLGSTAWTALMGSLPRAIVLALAALALLAHHGAPPAGAAGAHATGDCTACAHDPAGADFVAVCLGVLGVALALPGLAAAIRPRWRAATIDRSRSAVWRRPPRPPGRAPPRAVRISELCVLRR